jgi:hypothetical protein
MKSMKRSRLEGTISLTTMVAVLFLGSQSTSVFANSDTCCCAKPALSAALNRGYLSTPRAREEFPWLTRGGIEPGKTAAAKPVATTENRALAKTPRYIEEHPEVLRSGKDFPVTLQSSVPAAVLQNRAFAASPRAREEFPALSRTPVILDRDDKVQIAPLK